MTLERRCPMRHMLWLGPSWLSALSMRHHLREVENSYNKTYNCKYHSNISKYEVTVRKGIVDNVGNTSYHRAHNDCYLNMFFNEMFHRFITCSPFSFTVACLWLFPFTFVAAFKMLSCIIHPVPSYTFSSIFISRPLWARYRK